MEIQFTQDYLHDLYQNNVKGYKDYKSNPTLVKQYIKTINTLKSITRIEHCIK